VEKNKDVRTGGRLNVGDKTRVYTCEKQTSFM